MKVILVLLETTQPCRRFCCSPSSPDIPVMAVTLSTEPVQSSELAILCRRGLKMNKLHRGEVPKTHPKDVWLTDFSKWCFLH